MPAHIERTTARGAISDPPWARVPPTGPMLRPAEAAAYYGVSVSSYYEMVHSGELPKFVKLGPRARSSGVPRVWLDAVIAARVAASGAR
jgi:excisionase family DNA binding protein